LIASPTSSDAEEKPRGRTRRAISNRCDDSESIRDAAAARIDRPRPITTQPWLWQFPHAPQTVLIWIAISEALLKKSRGFSEFSLISLVKRFK
jgi:hypothetical protein